MAVVRVAECGLIFAAVFTAYWQDLEVTLGRFGRSAGPAHELATEGCIDCDGDQQPGPSPPGPGPPTANSTSPGPTGAEWSKWLGGIIGSWLGDWGFRLFTLIWDVLEFIGAFSAMNRICERGDRFRSGQMAQ